MPTRKPHQREADLPVINAWYLQGKSQYWIADELAKIRPYEVSRVTITNDLKEIRKRWRDETNLPIDEHVIKELARIDYLEQTYWREYEQSREPRKITAKSAKSKPGKPDAKGNATSQVEQTGSERTEEREGNPAFLQGVERCIKLRCDLLGLNAPQKRDDTLRIIDESTVLADLRRRVEAGELTREQVLKVTDNDITLADELFRGAANRVSTGKDKPSG